MTMANVIKIIIYTISAIGFLTQMFYVTEELMAPSFSDIEIKQEKLGLRNM